MVRYAMLTAPYFCILFKPHSLLITYYSLLITHYLLLITHYLLLITYYSLLITHYLLLITQNFYTDKVDRVLQYGNVVWDLWCREFVRIGWFAGDSHDV